MAHSVHLSFAVDRREITGPSEVLADRSEVHFAKSSGIGNFMAVTRRTVVLRRRAGLNHDTLDRTGVGSATGEWIE